jgi:hypothetical protein
MKTIVIDNQKFPFDIGCGLLKLKYEDCPFPEIQDIWDEIQPTKFVEIAKFENLEMRRVGIKCLGLDRLVKEIKPVLLDKKTIKKETTWVNENGELESVKFNDTYELYRVNGEDFSEGFQSWRKMEDSYYIKCKDTSTDREYLLWVDLRDVHRTNKNDDRWFTFDEKEVNAIQAIAWTIQTNIPKGQIEKIVRQGDCILIKPKKNAKIGVLATRHLTEKEYRELLVAES